MIETTSSFKSLAQLKEGIEKSALWGYILSEIDDPKVSDLILESGKPVKHKKDNQVMPCEGKVASVNDYAMLEQLVNIESTVRPSDDPTAPKVSLDAAIHVGGRRLRCSYTHYLNGTRMVLRPFATLIPDPQDLNMPEIVLKKGKRTKKGLAMITGATGSGKTTTMASLLCARARCSYEHIITLEDPIEFLYPDDLKATFMQREIGKHEKTFASGIKAALRQSPHVILIGEVRDAETAIAALNAAETGHYVICSFHTNNVESAIKRMIEILPEESRAFGREVLVSSLDMAVCQTLINKKSGGKVAIHEVMVTTAAVSNCISKSNWVELRSEIELGEKKGHITFGKSLNRAFDRKLIEQADLDHWKKHLGG